MRKGNNFYTITDITVTNPRRTSQGYKKSSKLFFTPETLKRGRPYYILLCHLQAHITVFSSSLLEMLQSC